MKPLIAGLSGFSPDMIFQNDKKYSQSGDLKNHRLPQVNFTIGKFRLNSQSFKNYDE